MLSLYIQMWMYQALGLVMFWIARLMWLVTLGAADGSDNSISDFLPLFVYNSLRFDMQSLTYISLPVIVAILVIPFLRTEAATKRCMAFMRHYYAVMLSLLLLLVVAEFFFHSNFNVRYNVVFFDFFDEGPLGLLQTMWQDYPMLTIILAALAVWFFIYYAGKFISRISIKRCSNANAMVMALLTLFIAGVTFIFMRGSVTRYTLQVEAFVVSTNDA